MKTKLIDYEILCKELTIYVGESVYEAKYLIIIAPDLVEDNLKESILITGKINIVYRSSPSVRLGELFFT